MLKKPAFNNSLFQKKSLAHSGLIEDGISQNSDTKVNLEPDNLTQMCFSPILGF